ncbi:MAG: hypothetical protein R3E96_13165 [Planctomycetota bacterium]
MRWTGEPLAPGIRLPDPRACAAELLPLVQRGETILIPGFSETVACAIEALVEADLEPTLVLGEGGPNLGGREMARRLERTGVSMRLVYDVALQREVVRADRVWMGTEAVGAGEMIAGLGTAFLMDRARRQQVPIHVLCTSDKLVPFADLRLPAWGETETYLLWDSPTEGLQVDSQYFERVAVTSDVRFATERAFALPVNWLSSRCRPKTRIEVFPARKPRPGCRRPRPRYP